MDTLAQTTGNESMELRAGDTLLLCTDGLWEPIIKKTVVEVLTETAPNVKAAGRQADSVGSPERRARQRHRVTAAH